MPIHDWTRVRANHFHDFHQGWTIAIRDALNGGRLPSGYVAMAEQIAGGPEPGVVTLSLPIAPAPAHQAVWPWPRRRTRCISAPNPTPSCTARKANRIVVRHSDGEVVAVIEIVSPGNKDGLHAVRSFARKAVDFLHGTSIC